MSERQLTVLIDHDVINRVPAVRFVDHLVRKLQQVLGYKHKSLSLS